MIRTALIKISIKIKSFSKYVHHTNRAHRFHARPTQRPQRRLAPVDDLLPLRCTFLRSRGLWCRTLGPKGVIMKHSCTSDFISLEVALDYIKQACENLNIFFLEFLEKSYCRGALLDEFGEFVLIRCA